MDKGEKIRLKATGEIAYCYTAVEKDGHKDVGNRRIPSFKYHYYKTPDCKGEEWRRDEFEWVPQWPYELYGVECCEGWHKLLEPIFDYIERYNEGKAEDDRMTVHQIKEKWGGLRVYLSHYDDTVRKLIEDAENEASGTCELCGSKENVGVSFGGWTTVKCHDCVKEWCRHSKSPHKWRCHADGKVHLVHPDKDDEIVEKNAKT